MYVGETFDLRQIQDIISKVRLVIGNETFKTIVNCDVDKITSLKMNSSAIKEIPDLSKFTKLENLKGLKNNTNLTINLSGNAIVDATTLLELNENTKINLSGNVNLTKESKEKLEDKFKKNVSFW